MRPKRRRNRPERPQGTGSPGATPADRLAPRPGDDGASLELVDDRPVEGLAGDEDGADAQDAGAVDDDVSSAVERVHQLEQQVATLSQTLAGLETAPAHGSDDRMRHLLQLAEILSVRYNPFLEHEEADPFTRQDVADVLPDLLPRGAEIVPVDDDPPARMRADVARPEAEEDAGPGGQPDTGHTRPAADHGQPAAGHAGPLDHGGPVVDHAQSAAGPPQPAADPGQPAADHARRALEPPEAPHEAPSAPRTGEAARAQPAPAESPPPPPAHEAPPASRRPVAWQGGAETGGSPKRAYWVLCWFERMAGEGDASAIHLFLDHYARLGWIPASEHAWMADLADGIAPRREGMTWADVQLSGVELARLHRRHLRFLDRLFRTGFREDDADAWERQAGDSLGAD